MREISSGKAFQIVNLHEAIELGYTAEVVPDDWVQCRVRWVSICGTDKRIWHGTMPMVEYPVIPGHECVVEYDKQLYALRPYVTCGECDQCDRNGEECGATACEHSQTYGVQRPGVLREWIAAPLDNLHGPLDMRVEGPHIYTMIEPLAVAMRAAVEAIGQCLIIGGNGQIGRLLKTLLQGPDYIRVDTIDVCSRGSEVQYAEYDTVFDCAGGERTATMAINACGAGGTVVLVGHSETFLMATPTKIITQELCIQGTRNAHAVDMDEAINELDRNYHRYRELVSDPYRFDELPHIFKNIDDMQRRRKIVVEVGE